MHREVFNKCLFDNLELSQITLLSSWPSVEQSSEQSSGASAGIAVGGATSAFPAAIVAGWSPSSGVGMQRRDFWS